MKLTVQFSSHHSSLSLETDDFYLQCFFLWHSVENLAILSGSGSQRFSDKGAVGVSIAHNRAVEARGKWLFSSHFFLAKKLPLSHLTEVIFFPDPKANTPCSLPVSTSGTGISTQMLRVH